MVHRSMWRLSVGMDVEDADRVANRLCYVQSETTEVRRGEAWMSAM